MFRSVLTHKSFKLASPSCQRLATLRCLSTTSRDTSSFKKTSANSTSGFDPLSSASSAASAASSTIRNKVNNVLDMASDLSKEQRNVRFDKQIAQDHREIEQTYDNFKNAGSNTDDKQKWANELIRLIAVHSFAEETSVYPAEERTVSKDIADHLREEHKTVKDLLYDLEKMKVTDIGYDAKLAKAMNDLIKHAQDEEKQYLPSLVAKLSQEEIDSVSSKFHSSKTIAPTRPHPYAPDKGGISQTLAGVMSKPLDAAIDMTKDFPESDKASRQQHQQQQQHYQDSFQPAYMSGKNKSSNVNVSGSSSGISSSSGFDKTQLGSSVSDKDRIRQDLSGTRSTAAADNSTYKETK